MDIISIEPKMLRGAVTVPPSKSAAHRAIIAASLSGGDCVLSNIAMSQDIEATMACMQALGGDFVYRRNEMQLCVLREKKRKLQEKLILPCGESGSTLRFLMPVSLLFGRPVRLTGCGRLMKRPQKPFIELFEQKGIRCKWTDTHIDLEGELKPGVYRLPGNVSSQFVTGLLFALPLLEGDSEIRLTTELESKGYVDLTLSVLKDFGIAVKNEGYRRFLIHGQQSYGTRDYTVEGDYSQAAFFLSAGALGCDIRCYGLNRDSLQGDKAIIEILKNAGAKIEIFDDGSIQARRTGQMRPVVIDAREIPDLVPVLAVMCAFCPGESRIIRAGRLRMKESDRLAATASELKHLGLDITEGTDELIIHGQEILYGTTVSAWNDHRIAMALAVAACRCEGEVQITGAKEAVKKSYPDFFEVYQRLHQSGPDTLLKFSQVITEEKA